MINSVNMALFRAQIQKPVVFFDLETTSADIKTCKIIDLAMVKINPENYLQPMDSFSLRINPGEPITNSDIHGITDEMVRDCPLIGDVLPTIGSFVSGCDLSGFNIIKFDVPVLLRVMNENGIPLDLTETNIIDAYRLFVAANPRSLDAMFDMYVGRERENSHTAEADTLDTIEATINMLAHTQMAEIKHQLPDSVEGWLKITGTDKMVDLDGKFSRREDGVIIINIGEKTKGQPASEHITFLDWMLSPKANFSDDTKNWCRKIIQDSTKKEPVEEEKEPNDLPFD